MRFILVLTLVTTLSAFVTTTPVLGTDLVLDLKTLWPNQDGNRWEYKQTLEVADWMVGGGDTLTSSVALRLDGTTIAFGGAEVQNLVEEFPGESVANAAFFRTLNMVRSDLRRPLSAIYSGATSEGTVPLEDWWALFLHGGAFELTTEEIATWRTSVQVGRSWLFLAYDMAGVGNDFQLQLIPDLAPDVILTGTNAGIEDVSTPAGIFENCLRIDYVLDFGTSLCTSSGSPDSLGSYRAETTGSVHYAPRIGPVRSEEELRYREVTGECGVIADEVARRIVLELTATNVTVPVRPSTWGQMKTRFLPEGAGSTR